MATPHRVHQDGIIDGHIAAQLRQCGNCKDHAWCIEIQEITLPEEIKPSNKLIAFFNGPTEVKPHRYIGVTCGCYAKFHRQIAHIKGKI